MTVPLTYGPSSHEAAVIQALALHPGSFGSSGHRSQLAWISQVVVLTKYHGPHEVRLA